MLHHCLGNDNERGLFADYEEWLEELTPHEPINRTGEACPACPEGN